MLKAVFAAWLVALIFGFSILNQWSFRAGEVGQVPLDLKATTASFHVPTDRANLFVFLHPRCSCTRATMTELENLIAKIHNQVNLHFYFFKPPGADDQWAQGDHWTRAQKLHPLEIKTDEDGKFAKSFGAETSGFTTLFDKNGHLIYAGGVTGARDHVGPNSGEEQILAFFQKPQNSGALFGKVFGCSMHSVTHPLRESL